MTIGVPRETFAGEKRVALTPLVLPPLFKAGMHVLVENDAGRAAGFSDEVYQEKGATIVARKQVFDESDMIAQVRMLGTNPQEGRADLDLLRPSHILIGISNPLAAPGATKVLAGLRLTVFDMEMIPRITRAQSMDVLSSQANIAGYKSVVLAAEALPKMFPMMTTAAGTIPPARVFILGVGVAGLQAIATARRLGAVVEAFDVRPEVKEQVQSLGAKFVEVELDTSAAKGSGGYAKEQSEDFLRRQRELMAKVVAASDVVITTAQVPGKKAPVLVTEAMVQGMAPGSVIVDLAAQQGGNVEPSRPGEVVHYHGVTIIGPTNVPSTVPFHASQMYAKNISAFILLLVKKGKLEIDFEDQIVRETLIARGGEVVNARVRDALGLPPLAEEELAKLKEQVPAEV
ncbi:MAG: Re/Si-specific NAD(P)(+) transhydrogenase subunit alpha [Acidobacteria bacterium]|nr:Re/Si-specific NAD(P)(+) transhydrogenase subunit alpha [Acidobacteriota bacterium]